MKIISRTDVDMFYQSGGNQFSIRHEVIEMHQKWRKPIWSDDDGKFWPSGKSRLLNQIWDNRILNQVEKYIILMDLEYIVLCSLVKKIKMDKFWEFLVLNTTLSPFTEALFL